MNNIPSPGSIRGGGLKAVKKYAQAKLDDFIKHPGKGETYLNEASLIWVNKNRIQFASLNLVPPNFGHKCIPNNYSTRLEVSTRRCTSHL